MEKYPESTELHPWSLFIFAMKAPMTRDRYKTRLARFLDSLGMEREPDECNIQPSLENKARTFAKKGKADFNWAFANILRSIY